MFDGKISTKRYMLGIANFGHLDWNFAGSQLINKDDLDLLLDPNLSNFSNLNPINRIKYWSSYRLIWIDCESKNMDLDIKYSKRKKIIIIFQIDRKKEKNFAENLIYAAKLIKKVNFSFAKLYLKDCSRSKYYIRNSTISEIKLIFDQIVSLSLSHSVS